MDDTQQRMDSFKEACLKASQEFNCDFYCFPQFVPSPDGSFRIAAVMQILDKTKLPMKSPLSDEFSPPAS